MNEEDLFRTWGEYLSYPQCCVDEFVTRVTRNEAFPYYMHKSVFDGSGYVPCESCHEATLGFTEQQAIEWLGRSPFEKMKGQLESFKSTLKKTQDTEFRIIADKHELDLVGYQEWLMNNIERLENR